MFLLLPGNEGFLVTSFASGATEQHNTPREVDDNFLQRYNYPAHHDSHAAGPSKVGCWINILHLYLSWSCEMTVSVHFNFKSSFTIKIENFDFFHLDNLLL